VTPPRGASSQSADVAVATSPRGVRRCPRVLLKASRRPRTRVATQGRWSLRVDGIAQLAAKLFDTCGVELLPRLVVVPLPPPDPAHRTAHRRGNAALAVTRPTPSLLARSTALRNRGGPRAPRYAYLDLFLRAEQVGPLTRVATSRCNLAFEAVSRAYALALRACNVRSPLHPVHRRRCCVVVGAGGGGRKEREAYLLGVDKTELDTVSRVLEQAINVRPLEPSPARQSRE
jgi:hypothetical protein